MVGLLAYVKKTPIAQTQRRTTSGDALNTPSVGAAVPPDNVLRNEWGNVL